MSWESLTIELLKASVVRPSILAGIGATALWLFKVRHPATRHAVWTAVLAGMLLIPFLSVAGPHLDLRVLPSPHPAVAVAGRVPVTHRPIAMPAFEPATAAPARAPMPSLIPAPIPAPPAPVPGLLWSIRMEDVVVVLYLLGLTVVGVRLAAGWLLLRRVLSRSTSRFSGLLRESPDVTAPVTVGLLRPVVLLPAGWGRWDVRARRAVLAHEFAHVRRKDTWTSALALLVRSLLWFHPLARWVRRETAQLAELACDLAALETAVSPAAYAELLLDWAKTAKRTGYRVSLPGLAVAGSAGLGRRIDQALAFSRSARRPRGAGVILALAGVPALALAAAVTLTEKPAVTPVGSVEVSGPMLSVPQPSLAPPQLGGEQAAEIQRDPAAVAVVTGRLSLSDGAPAPDIEVDAWQKDVPPPGATDAWTIVGRARTDAYGRYRIEIPIGGIYGVLAGWPFHTFYPGVTVAESARLVQVAVGQTVTSVDFALDPKSGVRVRGRIVPPPDAAAGLMSVGLGYPDRPDPSPFLISFDSSFNDYFPAIALRPVAADGSFEFPLVPPGTYTTRVYLRALDSSAYAGRRIVVRNAEVTGVEISAAGFVTGQIQDKAGVPAASIRVMAVVAEPSSATGTGTPVIARKTQTDADGRYRLNALPSGRYFIQADSLDLPSYFPGASAQIEARALNIAPGETIAHADFSLVSAGVRVTGKVTGIPLETPPDQLRIFLLEDNESIFSLEPRSAPVGPDGAFRFSGIPPRTYALSLSSGFGRSSGVAVLRVDGQRDIEGIEVPASRLINPPIDGIATISVPAHAAPPLFHVRGRVVAIAGVERPRQIHLRSFAMRQQAERGVAAEVHRDGSFEFQGVPEGGQDLVLENWPIALGNSIPWGRVFTLKADVDGFEFHLPTLVSGRLIMDGGAALPAPATILSTRSPSALGGAAPANNETLQTSAKVAPDGSFQLYAYAGEQNITAPSLPGYALTITVGSRTFLDGVLRIDGPLPQIPIEIRLKRLP